MIGQVTERELTPNLREKLTNIESELTSLQLTPLALAHGINIVESETDTLTNIPYIKGRTIVNHVPLFDSGLWEKHANASFDSATKMRLDSTGVSGTLVSYIFLDLKSNTTYTISSVTSGRVMIREGHDTNGFTLGQIQKSELGYKTVTFHTLSESKITIRLDNESISNEVLTFENISLVEGAEPKEFVRGFQPIRNPMFTAHGKNITEGILPTSTSHSNATVIRESVDSIVLEWSGGFDYDVVNRNVSPNTNYVLSFNFEPLIIDDVTQSQIRAYVLNTEGEEVLTTGTGRYELVFNSLNRNRILIRINRRGGISENPNGRVRISNVQLELGTEATPFEPAKKSHMYLSDVTLASNEDGSVYDELRPGGDVVKRFKHKVLDGTLPWVSGTNFVGYTSVRLTDALISIGQAYSGLVGSFLQNFSSLIIKRLGSISEKNGAIEEYQWTTGGTFQIFLPNAQTGWGDNYTPTAGEIKAYFNGWRMYQNESGEGTPYNGTGIRAWNKLDPSSPSGVQVGSGTLTLPTDKNDNPNWQPYKLQYQLAHPRVEKVNPIGRIQLHEGNNHIEIGEGIVVREKANPASLVGGDGTVWINNSHASLTKTRLNVRAFYILDVYKNGKADPTWTIRQLRGDAFGNANASSNITRGYDPTAVYYVQYIAVPYEFSAQVTEVETSYPANLSSKINQHSGLLGNISERVGVNEKVTSELFTSVDSLKRGVRSRIIGKGGTVEGTHPNSNQELLNGIESIEMSALMSNTLIGTTAIGANNINAYASPTLTPEQIIYFTYSVGTGSLGNANWTSRVMVECNITPTGAVNFSRYTAADFPIFIAYQIFSFRNLKKVLRGSALVSPQQTGWLPHLITLPQNVNRLRSFVLATLSPAEASTRSYTAGQMYRAFLDSNTGLRVDFYAGTLNTEWKINYQIVEFL
ncbi:hypothetical protein [Bacillus horti]|uniref:Uncharacterized protein n=1 Tax=Caldalkalibacillus horti TaxID=77523 RepID=A0ABT9W1C3_9BACI|nr:hypothetical protein [Bacillus horti]MDQ0166650.1 hypothetical protein [Bacillus horti]